MFKLKKNGTMVRFQVVNFLDNFAPVTNDVSFMTVLWLYIMSYHGSKIIDVKMAFLYGDLDDESYLQIPLGH